MEQTVDTVIVGTGVSGLFCALNLPADQNVLLITKANAEESDSFLAQGGICVLKDEADYDSYFEDTMRAGHYENDPASVEIMIRSSRSVIDALVGFGVEFARRDGQFLYTREGAHSTPRILFHEDTTGREITGKLLAEARRRPNLTIREQFTMVDLLVQDGECRGVVGCGRDGEMTALYAANTVLATGGVGGVYRNSTNYPHLTGDGVAVACRHGVPLRDVDYVQIHPTTLYEQTPGRRFLISESVRGEGAVLLNAKGERFVNELLPRDAVTAAIHEQMRRDGTPHVWLSLAPIDREVILHHFPAIFRRCLEAGYDVTREPIPVVPAQHYFMGGVRVGAASRTAMPRLYAVGETACNGVHGRNRLASNSLLESLVFARRAAADIAAAPAPETPVRRVDPERWRGCGAQYPELVRRQIETSKQERSRQHEQHHNAVKCG
ncbi:MAG: L-aspartate oxidase [Gemmiger sp.]